MTEEFRDEVRAAIRRHDPTADDLRSLSDDLEQLANRYETQQEVV